MCVCVCVCVYNMYNIYIPQVLPDTKKCEMQKHLTHFHAVYY